MDATIIWVIKVETAHLASSENFLVAGHGPEDDVEHPQL